VIPSASTSLSVAYRSALRMLKLVNALLDFSRIEAGERIAAIQAIDIARLTRDITAMFESTAQRAGVHLTVDCPPLTQLVEVDPDAWERIVSNVISNAVKFTPEGRPLLVVTGVLPSLRGRLRPAVRARSARKPGLQAARNAGRRSPSEN
jgi:signal transduction histidine kinase